MIDLPLWDLVAERIVLGSVMLEDSALVEVADILKPEHFYSGVHAIIFTTILKVNEAQINFDVITVTEELNKRNQLEDIGGVPYVMEILEAVPPGAQTRHYAEVVHDKWIRRSRSE